MGTYVKIFEVSGALVYLGTPVVNFIKPYGLIDKVISLTNEPKNATECITVSSANPFPPVLTFGYIFESLGRYSILPMDDTLGSKKPESALVLLKTPVGYRGSNFHSLDSKPIKKEVILRIPILYEGRKDQGSGEHIAVILPKGKSLRAQIHGQFHGQKNYQYHFDGENLESSTFKSFKSSS